jgi:hypothetical protein
MFGHHDICVQKALVTMAQFARFSCGAHCLVCFIANALQGTLPLNSESRSCARVLEQPQGMKSTGTTANKAS